MKASCSFPAFTSSFHKTIKILLDDRPEVTLLLGLWATAQSVIRYFIWQTVKHAKMDTRTLMSAKFSLISLIYYSLAIRHPAALLMLEMYFRQCMKCVKCETSAWTLGIPVSILRQSATLLKANWKRKAGRSVKLPPNDESGSCRRLLVCSVTSFAKIVNCSKRYRVTLRLRLWMTRGRHLWFSCIALMNLRLRRQTSRNIRRDKTWWRFVLVWSSWNDDLTSLQFCAWHWTGKSYSCDLDKTGSLLSLLTVFEFNHERNESIIGMRNHFFRMTYAENGRNHV